MKLTRLLAAFAACAMLQTATASEFENMDVALSNYQLGGISWANALPSQMNSLIGDNFTATSDNHSMELTLVEVIPGKIDPDRPAFLPRSQSSIAIFEASAADRAYLAEAGSQIVDISHYELGLGQVVVMAVKKPGGGISIEVVLN